MGHKFPAETSPPPPPDGEREAPREGQVGGWVSERNARAS